MSDSHTGFSSGAFTAGAVGGALTIASAVVAGMQSAAQINAQRWDDWTRDQLVAAVNLSEAIKAHLVDENADLREENAKLRIALRRRAMQRAAA